MKPELFTLSIISSIILAFSSLVQAGSLALRPDGVGTYTQYDVQFPASGEHWDKVDEETPDEDSTYIAGDSTNNDKDSYTLTDSGLPVVTIINSVTVYVRARKSESPPISVATFIRTNGADYTGLEIALSVSYVNYSTLYTTNPQTGSNWTVAEIDALEAGVQHTGVKNKLERTTQVWIDVIYTDTPDHYVESVGSNTYPYASWATAARTIQDAIDAASTGDAVWVENGEYIENVTINKNNLTVQSMNGRGFTFITGWVKFDPLSENFTAGTLDGFDITAITSTGLVYVCDPEAVYTIDGITIQNCSIHGNTSGPGIELDGNVDNTDITGNEIYSNTSAGVSMWDGVGTVTLSTNTIRNNAADGVRISYVTSAAQTVTIQNNNDIYSNGLAGVRNDSATSLTVVGNDIYSNGSSGIRNDAGTGTITQNNIYGNTMGGIGIQNSCTLQITKNVIRDNIRGGIHTGTDVVDSGGFSGAAGSAVLTIKQNKVYGNGGSGYGGGIDVRHADGTIYNNLVYENHRGGIRFGDWIDEIINNTVVDNGNATDEKGGGIIYDDINAGHAVNAAPAGTRLELPIRNNICAYNEKAGIRAGFYNTDGSEEVAYNLLFDNWGYGDCSAAPNKLLCKKRQLGGYYLISDEDVLVWDDPLFVDRAADDYRLQASSPAVDAGDTFYGDDVSTPPGVGAPTIDMGAYGGPDGIDW